MSIMVTNDEIIVIPSNKKKKNKKVFEICYTNICYIKVEADTEEEAMEKFEDNPSAFDDTLSIEGYQDPSINREIK